MKKIDYAKAQALQVACNIYGEYEPDFVLEVAQKFYEFIASDEDLSPDEHSGWLG